MPLKNLNAKIAILALESWLPSKQTNALVSDCLDPEENGIPTPMVSSETTGLFAAKGSSTYNENKTDYDQFQRLHIVESVKGVTVMVIPSGVAGIKTLI